MIGGRADLGAVPNLFGKPAVYARFLGAELRSVYRGRLLIVMPRGFGTFHLPQPEADALSSVPVASTTSDGLVRAAMAAVRASAEAAGLTLPVLRPTPVESPAAAGAGDHAPTRAPGGSSHLPVVAVAAGLAAALLIGTVGLVAWRRPRLRVPARPGRRSP